MPITAIHSITYACADLAQGIEFHQHFGLECVHSDAQGASFELPDGSFVHLHARGSAALPGTAGPDAVGVQQVCWAVDSEATLHDVAAQVARDREVQWPQASQCVFVDDAGLSVSLRVAALRTLQAEPDPVNAPGRVERVNLNRRWYERARPQQIKHVVFCTPQPRQAARFYVERLGFRISDLQEEGGVFLRAPGSTQHHSLYWQAGQSTEFRHVAYGVSNVDEIMAGAAHMKRHGVHSHLGLGRHRIASTFFYYLPNPCGGDAEYAADSDCLDDNWQPRVWGRAFGHIWWLASVRAEDPPPRVRLATSDDLVL